MLSGACWRVSHPARWCPDGAVQELFFQERFKCMQGRQGQADKNTDAFARTFGTAMPQSIPESSAWWLGRKDLGTVRVFAIACTPVFGRRAFQHVCAGSRWRVQQKELLSISDDSELGLMQSMVTPACMRWRPHRS